MAVNAKEYETCKTRGHEPGPMVTASIPPWMTCKYCGVMYQYRTFATLHEITVATLHEIDAPESERTGDEHVAIQTESCGTRSASQAR